MTSGAIGAQLGQSTVVYLNVLAKVQIPTRLAGGTAFSAAAAPVPRAHL